MSVFGDIARMVNFLILVFVAIGFSSLAAKAYDEEAIREGCEEKWSDNYSMIKYCEDIQSDCQLHVSDDYNSDQSLRSPLRFQHQFWDFESGF
jgi:hypothetical protein